MALESELDLEVERDSGVPLGTQLSWRLRSLIADGRLAPGDRLPSIRELAAAAGVNVNTVRAVYARLEREGVVLSEQGRGTFVAPRSPEGGVERRRLRRQIAALERELAARPPLAAGSSSLPAPRPRGGDLLTTQELAAVRDELLDRLRELDAARAEVLQRLEELRSAEEAEGAQRDEPAPRSTRGSTPSLAGARIRWLGA
jgi:DNA-binding transcriptional regulator YhcF (GntR family)